MSKKFALPAAIVLGGIAVIALLVVARPKPEPAPPAEEAANLQVSVVAARPTSQRLLVNAQGSVLPKREIDLVAQVSGQIVSVEPAFVDGGFFSTAQVLIRIDDREYQAALLAARARVAEAEKLLAEEQGRSRQAQREWRDLGNDNANDLFLRKPQLAAAQANLESARGEVARAELNLQRTKIQVPFDGRVKQTFADLGQFVSTGTRLATVYDSTVVEIRLPLTEKQAALVELPLNTVGHTREPVQVKIKGSVAGVEHEWFGLLTRTDAFVDANSRMYYAVVEVTDPFTNVPLLPGLFVEAEIQGKELNNVNVLPRSSLFERDKVVIVGEDNKTRTETVNVLRKTDTHVWFQARFDEDTLVTLEKQALAPDGTEVEPLQVENKTLKNNIVSSEVQVSEFEAGEAL